MQTAAEVIAELRQSGFLEELIVSAEDLTVPVAIEDQVRATMTHARKVASEIGQYNEYNKHISEGKEAAVLGFMLILTAIQQRKVASCCPHARVEEMSLERPRMIVVDLSGRQSACERCAPNVLRDRRADDDGLCDFCQRPPGDKFIPVVMHGGPFLVHGNLCDECADAMYDLTE